jgi:hypothetical protein
MGGPYLINIQKERLVDSDLLWEDQDLPELRQISGYDIAQILRESGAEGSFRVSWFDEDALIRMAKFRIERTDQYKLEWKEVELK